MIWSEGREGGGGGGIENICTDDDELGRGVGRGGGGADISGLSREVGDEYIGVSLPMYFPRELYRMT